MNKKYFEYNSYKKMLDVEKSNKQQFGLDSNFKWFNDPRQFFISQARYKFVAKTLSGERKVLEIGAADGFNSRIVSQEVKKLELTDNELIFKKAYQNHFSKRWKSNYFIHDFIKKKLNKKFSAIYMLDVLEHISKKKEKNFILNILNSLENTGTLIVGIPSLEFQKYSSDSKGHINCKTGDELKELFKKYFNSVYLFSMNDEIISTSFSKMACYLIVICAHKK